LDEISEQTLKSLSRQAIDRYNLKVMERIN